MPVIQKVSLFLPSQTEVSVIAIGHIDIYAMWPSWPSVSAPAVLLLDTDTHKKIAVYMNTKAMPLITEIPSDENSGSFCNIQNPS